MAEQPIWKPHPVQEEALLRDEFEVLFGGARGPGKTDAGQVWLLGDELPESTEDDPQLYIHHPRYRALVLRKNSTDLSDWIDRAQYMYSSYGARVVGNPPRIEWPSGAIFRTGHLKDRSSYEKYLGHEYQRILVEELNQIPSELYYLQILGSCRSTITGLKPQIFCTTNPGGIGHTWVKDRFVSVAPWGVPYYYKMKVGDGEMELSRIFIHATLDDNPTLKEKDPHYIAYLESLKDKDPDLYRAWRFGDWDVFAGQFFKEFRHATHVIPQLNIKSGIDKYGSLDWGYSAPHCFLGSVVKREQIDGNEFNRLITYKEIWGTELTPPQLAKKINESVNLDEYKFVMCDPAMFHRSPDGSYSIIDQMKEVLGRNFSKFRPANNDRIGGWAMMHKWLSLATDGLPYWLITDNCIHLIETIPAQIHDENNVEDIESDGVDHAVDSARYQQVHLRWIRSEVGYVKFKEQPTLGKTAYLINEKKFGSVKSTTQRDWRAV